MQIPEILTKMSKALEAVGGTPYLVGGVVRDHVMGIDTVAKDYDVEVLGIPLCEMLKALKVFGKVDLVGKMYSVLKLRVKGIEYDFSIPRSDIKIGTGHRGIQATSNPKLSFTEACKRRDLTINAMGYNLLTGELVDPYDGALDVKHKVLRAVDEDTFGEDPLRALRVMQFASRFGFVVEDRTSQIVEKLLPELLDLPKERVFIELEKLLLKSEKPSIGLQWAKRVGIVRTLWPELDVLSDCIQDPKWHGEGDVWEHTMLTVDEAAKLRTGDDEDIVLMLSCLLHDIGKPECTEEVDGNIRSRGHEEAGARIADPFIDRLTSEIRLKEAILPLIREHLKPAILYKSKKVSNKAIRKLALKVDIPMLCRVSEADKRGRISERNSMLFIEWMKEKYATAVENHPLGVTPLLKGKHLIELGMLPGKSFGPILADAFEEQLNDRFTTLEDAQNWVRQNY